MPGDDGRSFKDTGRKWANKIAELSRDHTALPHPTARLRNLLIAEARHGMHAGEMIMHLHEATSLARPDSDDLPQGRI